MIKGRHARPAKQPKLVRASAGAGFIVTGVSSDNLSSSSGTPNQLGAKPEKEIGILRGDNFFANALTSGGVSRRRRVVGGRGPQFHQGRPPPAQLRMIQRETENGGMLFQHGMDRATQVADPFAMNDAHRQDALPTAFGQIVQHEVFHLARLESVQVQHPVNRQLNRFVVHALIKPRRRSVAHEFLRRAPAHRDSAKDFTP